MKTKITILVLLIIQVSFSQETTLSKDTVFLPENKEVKTYKLGENQFIYFQSSLKVNTDGNPKSYHPFDLKGNEKALNLIGNAVTIKKNGQNYTMFSPPRNLSNDERKKIIKEAYQIFEQYRDNGFIPIQGYKINWNSVLEKNNSGTPCVLQSGEYKGYYVSGTSLKHDLPLNEKGECDCKNQINSLEIAGLVYNKFLLDLGAKKGDLAIVYNPNSKKAVFAIMYDKGPDGKLGEGSVFLNKKINEIDANPKIHSELDLFNTSKDTKIVIFTDTSRFELRKPFTQINIEERVNSYLKTLNIKNELELQSFLEKL